MENKDKPAFPIISSDGFATSFENIYGETVGAIGLTKREYFAAMALQGFIAYPGIIDGKNSTNKEQVVRISILYADELLKQLEDGNNKS